MDLAKTFLLMETSDEEMSFIRAIIDNPEDDAPRLIFADWLEERNLDAFDIRRQTIRTPHKNSRPMSVISIPLNREITPDWLDWRTGFIEEIRCPSQWWFTNEEMLTKYHPIRRVVLTTLPIRAGFTRWLYQQPMERVRSWRDVRLRRLRCVRIDVNRFERFAPIIWPNISFNYPDEA